MASTFTSLLRLEKIATGEQTDSWGGTERTTLDLLDESISGLQSVNCAGGGTITLTALDGASDQSRKAILVFTGILPGNTEIVVPSVSKKYLCINNTTGASTLTVKTAAGTGVIIAQSTAREVYCDGTNVNRALYGDGNALTDVASVSQVANSALIWGGTSGGSANAQTVTLPVAQAALTAGQRIAFIAGASNTTAMTLQVGALTAKNVYKGSTSGATALVGGEIISGQVYVVTYDGAQYQLQNPTAAAATATVLGTVNGRLTLETGVAISSSDQTAKTTVYFTPFNGNQIALYDGSSTWNLRTLTEKSIKLTDAQTGTTTNGSAVVTGLTDTSQLIVGMEVSGTGISGGTTINSIDSATQITMSANATGSASVTVTFKVAADTNLDIYCFDNSGTPKLEMVKWTNATTRATALALQDGVYVKTGATTRRHIGMVRTTGTAGQTEDSATKIFLRNRYNKIAKPGASAFSAVRTTTSTTWAEINSEIRIGFLVFAGEVVESSMNGVIFFGSGTFTYVDTAVGFDGTTPEQISYCWCNNAATLPAVSNNNRKRYLAEGYHYITVLGQVPLSVGPAGSWGDTGRLNSLNIEIS